MKMSCKHIRLYKSGKNDSLIQGMEGKNQNYFVTTCEMVLKQPGNLKERSEVRVCLTSYTKCNPE